MVIVAVLASVACVAWGRFAESAFGRKDPSQCTIDEWAGQAITFIMLPMGSSMWELLLVVAVAFVAFRVFDIVKPPPARQMEKLPAGWGVLMDDVFAGIYANTTAQIMLRLGFGLS